MTVQLEACWRWVSLLGLLYDGSMLMHMWGLSFYGLLGLQYIFIYTVNPGPFSCNYQAVNCKQVFLYLNSTVQTLMKSTVSESSLMFLSWNHFPTKTAKCSLNFKKPHSIAPTSWLIWKFTEVFYDIHQTFWSIEDLW